MISHQPDLYHGWPTLTRARSGQLLLSYSGGRESHVCPFGRVELMRSHDEGRTWGWPQALMDSAIDDRDSGVLETPRGSILVTTFTSLAYEPILAAAEKSAGKPGGWPAERLARWQAAHRRLSPGQRRSEHGCWMIRSTDGGVSWSARYPVPINSPHGPFLLSNGRLLYAGNGNFQGKSVCGLCESTDDGQSWQWLSALPVRPGDENSFCNELHAVEATDGRIIVHIRKNNGANAGETLQCESCDGGKTWTVPHAIGVWGLPSHLLRLADGRLLMSYGHRRPPFGNQVRVSSDHGQTWSDPLILSSDAVGGDLGYPSTVQLADGSLLTVWYEVLKDNSRAVLRQARWTLEG